MRTGGYTVQQALTAEAASVVKQSVSLARRRGHAQVTPLHVAHTMLSSPAGLFRAACLQSHRHPLHCKALELCFDVALNRLPTSTSSVPAVLGPHHYHHHHHHHHPPSLSNALIAAFKRAQAHQRRGSIETQQQPLLTVKIELDQFIISVLDDPSVSRVMREAGFSSTQVKTNVEQAVSISSEIVSTDQDLSKPRQALGHQARMENDVMNVVDSLLRERKRSMVVVGESLTAIEGVVRGVMKRVDNELQFITLPLYSFETMSREEVEHKVGELRGLLMKRCCVGRGVVLYLGDLRWAAEFRLGKGKRSSDYCGVEHVVMEIKSLVSGGSERFWVMGVATHQTFIKCRVGSPSLETVWGLQPIAVPSESLELNLNCNSDFQSQFKSKRRGDEPSLSLLERGPNQLACCADLSIEFDPEGRASSSLPFWLQQYKESKGEANKDQDCTQNLCKKWNPIRQSSQKHHHHHSSEINFQFSSVSPSSSISFYHEQHSRLNQTNQPRPIQHDVWSADSLSEGFLPNRRSPMQEGQRYPAFPCSYPNPSPKPTSSSDHTMYAENPLKFKELNAENLKIICNRLEREVPWQLDIIPEIASTILQCRSGMVRKKERAGSKEETWLFFLGGDVKGKERIARELASLVFGSHTSLLSIGLNSTFSSMRSDSTDGNPNSMSRSEASHIYIERLTEAITENPHRVILMQDIEQVDSCSQVSVRAAIEKGSIKSSDGEEFSICDAIIILCCESLDSISSASSPHIKQRSESEEVLTGDQDCHQEISSCVPLDLNISVGDEGMDCCSFDDAGLLESVDRALFFRLPERSFLII